MYALYNIEEKSKSIKYSFADNISLFGCNNGLIPKLLSTSLKEKDTEPFKWNLNVREALEKANGLNQSIIINLKPNSSKPNLSLYELKQVWGYSDANWTPLMFHLRGIFIDELPKRINTNKFERKLSDIDDFIFSLAYVKGTIKNGKIEGKWIAPRPSSTNSVLLWPDAFNYFILEYQKLLK